MVAAGLRITDQLLRGDGPFAIDSAPQRRTERLVLIILAYGAVYGAVMGTFLLDAPQRYLQILYSATKVPLLLLSTTALCLPGFFVLNTVLGLRDDLRAAIHAILAGQAALSVALAALGPVTHFWYWSEESYRGALLFNAGMFTLATIAGQAAIRRYYRPLIRRNGRHRITLTLWFALYAFVGIQMGWMLRPFVGDPRQPVSFFRAEPFSNAYIVVIRLFSGQ
jgi:hypothetical protein